MITVKEAFSRILAPLEPLPIETIPVEETCGRTLAEDIIAMRATPAFDSSAMDGYAVIAADLAKTPTTLKLIGEAPAGTPFPGTVQHGEAVRIFTGGLVPKGANTVVIQENTKADGDTVTVLNYSGKSNIRAKGGDFGAGDVLIKAGTALNDRGLALVGAANCGQVPVYKSPRVTLLGIGDELVAPGSTLKYGSVINTNAAMLAALIRTVGATPVTPKLLPDELDTITSALRRATSSDVIVSLGGASVGDYDFVGDAFNAAGGNLDFWKIAMKPGKPLMYGEIDGVPVFGLPGNPVSAYVTAYLFLLPALRKLQGQTDPRPRTLSARAGGLVQVTKDREVFNLAKLSFSEAHGSYVATPHPVQDSGRISTLNASDCLIYQPANADAVTKDTMVKVYPLPHL